MPQTVQVAGPVWRVRRGVARSLGFVSVIAGVGPVALAMLMGLLDMVIGHDLVAIAAAVWVLAWLVGIPLLMIATALADTPWRLRSSDVELGSMGISICRGAKTQLVPRAHIVGALVVGTGADAELEITLDGGDLLVLRVPSDVARYGAIDALGLGADKHRIAIVLDGAGDAMTPGCVGILVGVVTAILLIWAAASFGAFSRPNHWLLYALGSVVFVTALLVKRAFEAKRVVVGTDGVRIEGGFTTRFVPRNAVQNVTTTAGGSVVLTRRNARAVTIRCGARAAALAARIDEALRVGKDESGQLAAARLLERRGRGLSEWRADLRLLSGADPGYRRATLTGDALLDVVRDPDAPVERRIGAAMALGAGADHEAREQLRFTTEGLASEHLRVAMEKAACDELDEDSLEEALNEAGLETRDRRVS